MEQPQAGLRREEAMDTTRVLHKGAVNNIVCLLGKLICTKIEIALKEKGARCPYSRTTSFKRKCLLLSREQQISPQLRAFYINRLSVNQRSTEYHV